jgi:hypothetical protein
MGSIFSKVFTKLTGAPEIDFRKGKGKDVLQSLLVQELVGEKGKEVVKKLDDVVLAAAARVIKDEQKRRLEDDDD